MKQAAAAHSVNDRHDTRKHSPRAISEEEEDSIASKESLDLSDNVPHLIAFQKERLFSVFSLFVFSSLLNFHKKGKFENEKTLALFETKEKKNSIKISTRIYPKLYI